MKPHRIAAGGIILKGDSVLLVRYEDKSRGSYLVGPGGALLFNENAAQAVVRETLEETGVNVWPEKLLFIEDLQCNRYKMCKIWMLCEVVGGELKSTEGARQEGIIEARWYNRDQLKKELVFPSPLMQNDWNKFILDTWDIQVLPSLVAGC